MHGGHFNRGREQLYYENVIYFQLEGTNTFDSTLEAHEENRFYIEVSLSVIDAVLQECFQTVKNAG